MTTKVDRLVKLEGGKNISSITIDKAITAIGEDLSYKSKTLSAYKKAGDIHHPHAQEIKTEYEHLTKQLQNLSNSQVCSTCGHVLWNHPLECRKK